MPQGRVSYARRRCEQRLFSWTFFAKIESLTSNQPQGHLLTYFWAEEASRRPSAAVGLGSSRTMSNDNKGVADPGDDQDHSQDIHEDVASGVVADLVGDREGRGRQHEMG